MAMGAERGGESRPAFLWTRRWAMSLSGSGATEPKGAAGNKGQGSMRRLAQHSRRGPADRVRTIGVSDADEVVRTMPRDAVRRSPEPHDREHPAGPSRGFRAQAVRDCPSQPVGHVPHAADEHRD